MSNLNHDFYWGAVVYHPPAGSFSITCCDGGDSSPLPLSTLRGTFTERLRYDDKVMLAIVNSRRALKARNLRRAKYWSNQAQHWLDRRRQMFGPIG